MKNNVLSEIKRRRKPKFIETNPLRLHKGIAKLYKFTAVNEYAHTISDALVAVCNSLYNKMRNNRKNASLKMSINVREKFIKNLGRNNAQKKYIYHTKNFEQEINKFHKSNTLTLYPRSDIKLILDRLEQQLIQTRFDNMAANEGSSNHLSLYFDTTYLKFHEVNPPGIRSYIETSTDLKNKYATINPKNKDKCFFVCYRY